MRNYEDGTCAVNVLVDEFIASNIAKGAAYGNARTFNPLADRAHAAAKALRETEAGRKALAAQMKHDNPTVRLSAAIESTPFARARAVRALKKLGREDHLWDSLPWRVRPSKLCARVA